MKTQPDQSLRMRSPILWSSAWAVAAIYGAFTLSWVMYQVHLGWILSQFGFSDQLAPLLLLCEALLAIALEPLAGLISDQSEQRYGSRHPVISFGVCLAAVLMISIATLAGSVDFNGFLQHGLMALLVAWAIAMSLFRSPALAQLRQFAAPQHLPLVTGLITLTGALASAASPLAETFIFGLGTFKSGVAVAILLLAAMMMLWSSNPTNLSVPAAHGAPSNALRLMPKLATVAGLGFATTLLFQLVNSTFPRLVFNRLPALPPSLPLGVLLLTMAIVAIPGSRLTLRWGNRRTIWLGAGAIAAGLGMLVSVSNIPMAFVTAILLGAAFGIVANAMLAIILSLASVPTAGLMVGCAVSGSSAAISVFGLWGAVLTRPGLTILGVGFTALAIAAALTLAATAPSSYR